MSNIYYRNSNGRTRLDKVLTTVKFNSVFPTFQEWKTQLENKGIDTAKIIETEFNLLQTMVGNAYLKFTTPNKNIGYIAFKFDEIYSIREREQQLYDKSLQDMLTDESDNDQRFFTVNRSDITGEISDDFLNNSARSTLKNTSKAIDYISQIDEWRKIKPPKQKFLTRLANIMVLPYQPEESYDFEPTR